MNEFHLLIDDIKDLNIENVARNATDGKIMLRDNPVTHLYIDHDLGEEESGYDIVNWALENDCLPPYVQIVSYNPVGRDNIIRALENAGYVKKNSFYVK